jgi:hypothetical protein
MMSLTAVWDYATASNAFSCTCTTLYIIFRGCPKPQTFRCSVRCNGNISPPYNTCPLCVRDRDTDRNRTQSNAAAAVSWQMSCAGSKSNPVVDLIWETIRVRFTSYTLLRIIFFFFFYKLIRGKNNCPGNNALRCYFACSNDYRCRGNEICFARGETSKCAHMYFYFKNITITRCCHWRLLRLIRKTLQFSLIKYANIDGCNF